MIQNCGLPEATSVNKSLSLWASDNYSVNGISGLIMFVGMFETHYRKIRFFAFFPTKATKLPFPPNDVGKQNL